MSKVLKRKRNPNVTAGIFLLLTGFILTAAFLTRFDYLSGITNISDDLDYLSDNRLILQINSFFWLGSALFMIFASSSLFSSMSTYRTIPAYLTGFFFLLSAFMFLMSGIKGLGVIELISYQENKVINPVENEYFKANVIRLIKERDIFIRMSAALTGFGLFSTGLFSLQTRKIPLFHGFLSLLTGLALPVVLFGFPGSPLLNLTLICALFMILLIGMRMTFKGFVRKK